VIDRGSAVAFDYGETAEGLEHRRPEGTLRIYRSHHLGPVPLVVPGETDITADMNFTGLMAATEAAGARVNPRASGRLSDSLAISGRWWPVCEAVPTRAAVADGGGCFGNSPVSQSLSVWIV